VQFHWDRPGKHNKDEQQATHKHSSCWVRVSQPWAGKGWGASFWPRIGQEVIVAFLEGDPDQPIIVGSVYNADQIPPYLGAVSSKPSPDPKHKHAPHLCGVKSNTTLGGEGFNEWRFDDTKDKQQIFIHAERNIDTRVKKDCMETIGGSRHLSVGGDQNEQIGGKKNLTVKKDHIEKIEGNMLLFVGGEEGGNQDIIIQKTKKELIEENDHLHVLGDRMQQVDGSTNLTVGKSQFEDVKEKHSLHVGDEIFLKCDKKVVIEAGMELTLVQGANFIKLDAAGVTIFGAPMTLINSGGAAGQGSPPQITAPEDAAEAKPAGPTPADEAKTGQKSAPR
jgi:type VI secretion system secreted protein VgrG